MGFLKTKIGLVAALALLAGCSTPDLSDPRAQRLVSMDGPQHYAERRVARELAGRCQAYTYDEELAQAMSQARVKAGQPTSIQLRGAVDLETDIRRRSLAARYGANWSELDPCAVLDTETAQGSPMSVLVQKRG